MSTFLDILRAAIPSVAAARGGYMEGERIRDERDRARAREEAAAERQSRLDQIKEALDRANANEANARADALRHPAPKPITAPHTITTSKGILQWNPDKGVFEPTGFQPPAPASSGSSMNEAREGRLRTQGALTATRQQIKDTQTTLDNAQADAQPGDPAAKTRIGSMIQSLNSLRRDADSLTAATKSPVNAATYDEDAGRFIPLSAGGSAPSHAPARSTPPASRGNVDLRQPSDPTEVAANLIRTGKATLEQLDASGKSKAFKDSVKARLRRP